MMSIIFMLIGCLLILNVLSLEMLSYIMGLSIFFLFLSYNGVFFKMSYLGLGMGVDIVSFSMVGLSLLIGLLMLLSEKSKKKSNFNYIFKFLVVSVILLLVGSFLSISMFMFYLFFELVLIPMVMLVLIFGSQAERLESGVYMLMYTMFGSLPLLMGILVLWKVMGSIDFCYVMMMKLNISNESKWGWVLMLGFLVKLPMYSVHIWLPKAHVEASVSGSSILAGVLLKLGCYGFYRFYLFTKLGKGLESLMVIIGLWGGFLSAFSCYRHLDMKKLVAYSSVVHSGLFLGGVMMMSGISLLGGLIMMVGHGLCSSGLFFFVNLLYERMFSRNLLMVKGSLVWCPSLMLWGFLLIIVNSGTPPFLNFFGEILLGMGVLLHHLDLMFILILIYFVGVGYSLYFYSVVSHGKGNFLKFEMISVSEYFILMMHFWPGLMLIFF